MQLKDLMMSLVLVGLFVFCIAGAVYTLNAAYNTEKINLSVVQGVSDDMDSISETAETTHSLVSGGDISAGGILGIIFNGIGNFLKVVLNIITIPFKWLADIGTYLGIPKQITYALTTLLLIVAVFAIISIIVKRQV